MEIPEMLEQVAIRMRQFRKSSGVPERHLAILELLKDGGMNVSKITAIYGNASESTISTTITKLWDKGYVEKTIDRSNQRVTTVTLTEKGKHLLEKMTKQRKEGFYFFLKGLNANQEEEEIIRKLLTRAISFYDTVLAKQAR
jgi:DNA-binding MarR family transcriptional regulator